MIEEALPLALALIGGLGLGILFFGGLRFTVEQLPVARRPGLLIAGSFAARTLVTLAGFFLLTGGQWARLFVCVLGFLVAKAIVVCCLQPRAKYPISGDGGRRKWS
ncbi:MAG: ATP synthase subunit I [Chloroflexota bacterium]